MGWRLRALRQKEMLLGIGGVAALALLALWLALPGLIAARWTAQLRALGFPQAELAVDSLGWTRATGAFSLGGEEGADRFEAAFTPAGLWRRRLSGLEVQGLRLSRPLSLSSPGLPAGIALDGPAQFKQTRLTLALPGGIGTLPLLLDAALTPADGGWHAEGQGAVTLADTGVPVRFTGDWRGDALSAAGFTLAPVPGGPRLDGQGTIRRLSNGGWTGDLDVTATSLPQGLPDLTLRWKAGQGDALLEWPGIARLDALLDPDEGGGQQLAANLRVDDIAGFAARLGKPDPGLTGGPLAVSLTARNIAPDLPPRTWPDLALRLEARGVGIGQGPRDNALSLSATARRIDGDWWLSPAADQVPGALSMPTLGLEARGLLLAGRAALPLDMDLRAASLRLPWLASSSLTAKLRGEPAGDMRMEWQAATLGEGAARLSGVLDLSATGGSAVARLAPLQLTPGDAARLFPGAPLPAGLSGIIAARLTAAWAGGSVDGAADILLEDVGLRLPGLHVAGVSGVVRFDRLSPLSMPQQTLSIGLFDPGLALSAGGVGLSLPGDGVLRVAPEPFTWAGQKVTLPQSLFRLGNDHLDLVLDVPATPLPDVLAALGITDTEAEGALTGSIPVRIGAAGASPGAGGLRATGPGRLSLPGTTPPPWLDPAYNDNLALVARALADYRFRSLELSLTGQGPRLSLDGANPSLYGGYAMPMNLIVVPTPLVASDFTPSPAVAAGIASFKARRD